MTKAKVVHVKNLPRPLPIVSTVVLWLLMDRLQVHGVWVGVIWTVWVIFCALMVAVHFLQEQVDIFEKKP